MENGEVLVDKKQIFEHWTESFKGLYENNGDYDDGFLENKIWERDQIVRSCRNVNQLQDVCITYQEVEKVVMSGKNNKAVRVDNISNEVLKHASVIHLLTKLFRKIFDTGYIPELWQRSLIHLIPKGENKLVQPFLYRWLALQSYIYKLYSSVLNTRLGTFFESEQLISETQNGFHKNRSCAQHLFTLRMWQTI